MGYCKSTITSLGGWTNPSEKYDIVKLDHFPKLGVEIKKIFETTT